MTNLFVPQVYATLRGSRVDWFTWTCVNLSGSIAGGRSHLALPLAPFHYIGSINKNIFYNSEKGPRPSDHGHRGLWYDQRSTRVVTTHPCRPLPWPSRTINYMAILIIRQAWAKVMVVCHGCLPGGVPYSPRLALRVGERQSWVKCLVQEHNVAAAGSDGSSLPTQLHFTATPGDQAFEPPSGFESPTLSITSRACYRLSHRATTMPPCQRSRDVSLWDGLPSTR